MSSKQVECPECGGTYKVQGLYGHLRMGHGLHGDELEEKYSEAVGESRGAGVQHRKLSAVPPMKELFEASDEKGGVASGVTGTLRELAIARRMQEIAEEMNDDYSQAGKIRKMCEKKVASLEYSLAKSIVGMSETEEEPPEEYDPDFIEHVLSG